MEKQNIIIQTEFQGIILNVKPDEKHKWLLTTEEVAKGYGVSIKTIREHKRTKLDELEENLHFITARNSGGNPRAGIPHIQTFWTREGVIMLGFFIRSDRAKIFRKWASQLILSHLEKKENNLETLKSELKQELKNELQESQTELIHNLKQNFLEMMDAKTKQNNKDLVWQFWEYLNLVQSKLEERIEKLEPPKIENLDDWNAYMYLMKKKNTTRHKLGKSGKPDNRRKNIQSNSGDEIELVLTIKMPNTASATALESYLKDFFKEKKIRGEWYNFDENDVMMMRMITQVFETYFAQKQ